MTRKEKKCVRILCLCNPNLHFRQGASPLQKASHDELIREEEHFLCPLCIKLGNERRDGKNERNPYESMTLAII
jgi:hypothetical protein